MMPAFFSGSGEHNASMAGWGPQGTAGVGAAKPCCGKTDQHLQPAAVTNDGRQLLYELLSEAQGKEKGTHS